MSRYWLTQVVDHLLLPKMGELHSQCRLTTADFLAYLGEADHRGRYLAAGYPSMFKYCVSELNLSEDSAGKRIYAARAARQYPAIFPAVADGRLHLSAVVMLAGRLTPENADELIAAASHRSKAQIELMLAERFPDQDVPTRVRALAPVAGMAVQPVGSELCEPLSSDEASGQAGALAQEHVAGQAGAFTLAHAPGHASAPSPYSRVTPLSPGKYRLETTLEQASYDDLALAKALLAHSSPACDEAEVIERALRMLAAHLQRRASGATSKPRPQRGEPKGRHVPIAVRREVWERDGGCCSFVSESGVRCGSNRLVQIDHVVPFATGGKSTSENLRLLCGPHNQYEAKRRFGAGFVEEKQRESRERTELRRAQRAGQASAAREPAASANAELHAPGHVSRHMQPDEPAPDHSHARANAELHAPGHVSRHMRESSAPGHLKSHVHVEEVIPYLRALRLTKHEARRGAEFCAGMPEASLEERVKTALQGLTRARYQRSTHAPSAPRAACAHGAPG